MAPRRQYPIQPHGKWWPAKDFRPQRVFNRPICSSLAPSLTSNNNSNYSIKDNFRVLVKKKKTQKTIQLLQKKLQKKNNYRLTNVQILFCHFVIHFSICLLINTHTIPSPIHTHTHTFTITINFKGTHFTYNLRALPLSIYINTIYLRTHIKLTPSTLFLSCPVCEYHGIEDFH